MAGDLGVRKVDETSLGDSELFTNKIEARDFFRDGVFHLQASIDLEERDGAVRANQELAGSRPDVPDLFQDVL